MEEWTRSEITLVMLVKAVMLKHNVQQHLFQFVGAVYRGHDPRWSFAPESGEGAKRNGGRFNAAGVPALYTSLSQSGAWVEAQQGFRYKAQPLTICQYDVDCERVLDLTNESVLLNCGIKPSSLSCAWLDMATRNKTPDSWLLASILIESKVNAIIVPSFAKGATEDMKNVIFWKWSDKPPCKVNVIDDFNRLPKSAP
jgi:RES domain-containing protein